MDGGSILPVLALDLQLDDNFLDMCAAPGGKSLAAIQTLLPATIVSNDKIESRVKKIKQVMGTYISNISQWDKKILITTRDARVIDDYEVFNKVSLFQVDTFTQDSHSNRKNCFSLI